MSEPLSKSPSHWTKEDIYDDRIGPLMSQIIAVCKEHQIPMVARFQYANDEEDGPAFCTTVIAPEETTCDEIMDLARRVQPRQHVTLAETIVTQPDGSKQITIRRVT